MTKRKQLKLFRIERDMNQQAIASRLGFSRSQYALIERGARGGSIDFWENFQKEFNIPDADMWGLMKRNEKSKQGEGNNDK